jgi:hypothetical protein
MRNALGAVAIVCTLHAPAIHAAPQIESDPKVQELEQAANTKRDPESWYFLAAYCLEKSNETALPTSVARAYVIRGLEADDRALAMNGDYYEAVVLKSVLLRQRVKHENDPYVRAWLDSEAAIYSFRAAEIAKKMQPRVGPPRPRY